MGYGIGATGRHVNDGGQRAHCIGHVVGAVGEAEQGSRKNQGPGEQVVDGFFVVAHGLCMPVQHRAHQKEHRHRQGQADHHRRRGADCDNFADTFEQDVRGKAPAHQGHQPGHHGASRQDLVGLVGDGAFDQEQQRSGHQSTEHGRDDPAGRNLPHLAPGDDVHASRCNARAHHCTDDGVRGGHRRANGRGCVQPEGCCK